MKETIVLSERVMGRKHLTLFRVVVRRETGGASARYVLRDTQQQTERQVSHTEGRRAVEEVGQQKLFEGLYGDD